MVDTTLEPPPPVENPFRPGAGHKPPYLAGRAHETTEFMKLLGQKTIMENLILTGLRGLGKTVLLETFKPMAIAEGWLWAGTDLSESTSISEDNLAIRILTDLSVVTTGIVITQQHSPTHFGQTPRQVRTPLDYRALRTVYETTPGLVADKLKAVLELVWGYLKQMEKRGVIFAYDEAQNLADHAAKEQFPLSLLLDVFQSLQRKDIPFMLALTGLPTLFPKLVEARTYSERMFHVVSLGPLSEAATREAIERPIEQRKCPVHFKSDSLLTIWQITHGYPYFIQYVCREVYDVWVQDMTSGQACQAIPVEAIMRKLDVDFFSGRWGKATDRQRELLTLIANLESSEGEFTVQEIVDASQLTPRHFSNSHANQMLSTLSDNGLVFKNRHGKYSFAVPLMDKFIKRQTVSSILPFADSSGEI
jgi:hypothetical protein